jgi:hypothetical protein
MAGTHLDSNILRRVNELLSSCLLASGEQAEDQETTQRAANDDRQNDAHNGADGATRGTDSVGHGLILGAEDV